jgi:hypothetical protein
MNFCLPRDRVEKFVEGLKSGELDPEKLSNMTSSERHDLLSKYVGEGAGKLVNAEFESKLLLKNQNQGIATWIKNTAGLKPDVKRDLLSRVSKLDKVLDPADKEKFLSDLAARKLGADVTPEEAQHIAELSRNVSELEGKTSYADAKIRNVNDLAKYDFSPTEADAAYGKAVSDFRDYFGDLKNQTEKFRASDLKGSGTLTAIPKAIKGIADLSKSVGASLDDSFFGRQGLKAAITNPKQWAHEFVASFGNIAKSLGGKDVDKATHAFLMADPMYKQALKDGLKIIGSKDVFPTSLPEKIPILGRAFKASESAYASASDLMRFSIYKQQMKRAAELGVDLSGKNESRSIAKFVNSLTGGGDLGSLEKVGGIANVAFYSLRFLKSNVDTLLLHPVGIGVGGVGSYAQKQAAKSLIKIVSVLGGVLATANALQPGSVDLDPRSTDFGKIRVGDTRFDISGGMGSLITLAARILPTYGPNGLGEYSKSSTTGKVTQLGTGKFGSQTAFDAAISFFDNKLSPMAGVASDILKQKDHNGNKPTIAGEAGNLVTPLGVKNFQELMSNPNAANVVAAMIADGLGISTNTYSPSGQGAQGSSWAQSQSKTLQAFKQQVGDGKFQEAGKKFDDTFNTWISSTRKDPNYTGLSTSDQASVITKEKAKIQATILKDNGFKYKAPPTDKNKFSNLLQ